MASVPSVVISALMRKTVTLTPLIDADQQRRPACASRNATSTEAAGERQLIGPPGRRRSERHDHRRERGDRADREVELAADQQQRRGTGDDADARRVLEDVDEVRRWFRRSNGDVIEKKTNRTTRTTNRAAVSGSGHARTCLARSASSRRPAPQPRRSRSPGVRRRPADAAGQLVVSHAYPPAAASSRPVVISSPRQLGGDASLDHDIRPVGDLDRLLVVGRHDEHRHALRGEIAQRAVDVRAGADIDAARRLDEHQRPRVALQPTRQQHLLLVAARQRAHRLLGVVARADRQAFAPATGRPLPRPGHGSARAGTGSASSRRPRSPRLAGPANAPPALRSAGRKPMPAPMAAGGPSNVATAALDLQACHGRGGGCRSAVSPTSAAPEPSLPNSATTSPGVTADVDVLEGTPRPAPVQRSDWRIADGVGRAAPGAPPRPSGARSSPRSSRGRSVAVHRRQQRGRAVAQHLDPVGDLGHLVEAVGDVDDGDALVAQPSDEARTGPRPRDARGRRSAHRG